jgi:hypothetical protein
MNQQYPFLKEDEILIPGTINCSICEKDKPYHYVNLKVCGVGQSRAKHVDDAGKKWGKGSNKKVCPDCRLFIETQYKHIVAELTREYKENKIYKLSCKYCSKEFTSSIDKRCCSKECSNKLNTKIQNDRRKSLRVPKTTHSTCERCNKEVIQKKPTRFCSVKCRVADYNKKAYIPRPKVLKEKPVKLPIAPKKVICKECKVGFETSRNAEYCSKVCRKRCARREGREKRYKPNREVARAAKKKREMAILKRLPKWANHKELDRIYKERPDNMQVDHIIPLRGEIVSGLHVEYNLQYLTPEENHFKRAKFDGTYNNESWREELTNL